MSATVRLAHAERFPASYRLPAANAVRVTLIEHPTRPEWAWMLTKGGVLVADSDRLFSTSADAFANAEDYADARGLDIAVGHRLSRAAQQRREEAARAEEAARVATHRTRRMAA